MIKIGLLGLGGGGGNTVKSAFFDLEKRNFDISLAVANTDIDALNKIKKDTNNSPKIKRIVLGETLLLGKGAGASLENGALAAIEAAEEIEEFARGKNLIFITLGLGGGTGSGSLPIVMNIIRSVGSIPMVFTTWPWKFEGTSREKSAFLVYNTVMKQQGSGIMNILHNEYSENFEEGLDIEQIFRTADRFLLKSILSIYNLLIDKNATINIDWNDVRNTLRKFTLGYFFVENGKDFKPQHSEEDAEDNVEIATNIVEKIIKNPSFAKINQKGNLVINISGSKENMSMSTMEAIMQEFNKSQVAADIDAKTIFGISFNDFLRNNIVISGYITNITYDFLSNNPNDDGDTFEDKFENLVGKVF